MAGIDKLRLLGLGQLPRLLREFGNKVSYADRLRLSHLFRDLASDSPVSCYFPWVVAELFQKVFLYSSEGEYVR